MAKHKPKQPKKGKKTASAKAKAQRAAEKIAAEAQQKAKHTATLTTLKPIAKEINVRLEQAARATTKAADHRLAAALRLAEAKALCEKVKLHFKPWVEANIERSYGDANRLAIAGASENPEEAVATMRDEQAARRQKSQAKLREARLPATGGGAPAITEHDSRSPFQRAADIVAALDDTVAMNLVTDVAAEKGMVVVSKHDHSELGDLRKAQQNVSKLSLDRVKHDFDGLVASEKMALVEYAAKKVGVKIVTPTFDDTSFPAFLDRSKRPPREVKRGAKA